MHIVCCICKEKGQGKQLGRLAAKVAELTEEIEHMKRAVAEQQQNITMWKNKSLSAEEQVLNSACSISTYGTMYRESINALVLFNGRIVVDIKSRLGTSFTNLL